MKNYIFFKLGFLKDKILGDVTAKLVHFAKMFDSRFINTLYINKYNIIYVLFR